MSDITEKPYAKWLEDILRQIVEADTESIAVVAMDEKGEVQTFYYQSGAKTLMYMAGHLQAEATLAMCQDNARTIIAAAEEDGEEDSHGE